MEILTLFGTHALATLVGLIIESTPLRPIGRLCDLVLRLVGDLGDKADDQREK